MGCILGLDGMQVNPSRKADDGWTSCKYVVPRKAMFLAVGIQEHCLESCQQQLSGEVTFAGAASSWFQNRSRAGILWSSARSFVDPGPMMVSYTQVAPLKWGSTSHASRMAFASAYNGTLPHGPIKPHRRDVTKHLVVIQNEGYMSCSSRELRQGVRQMDSNCTMSIDMPRREGSHHFRTGQSRVSAMRRSV